MGKTVEKVSERLYLKAEEYETNRKEALKSEREKFNHAP